MRFIRKYYEKFQNLIRWFPIIWNDYQWDYASIYDILYFKLKLMHHFHQYETIVCREQADQTCNEINICLLALDRLIKNDYLTDALKAFGSLYPDFNWSLEFEDETTENGVAVSVLKDTMSDEQRRFFRTCGDKADKAELDDIAVLFKTLQNCIKNWWD